jgi:hypothetical protein
VAVEIAWGAILFHTTQELTLVRPFCGHFHELTQGLRELQK